MLNTEGHLFGMILKFISLHIIEISLIGKWTDQKDTWNQPSDPPGNSSKAVDGNTDGDYFEGESCSHTGGSLQYEKQSNKKKKQNKTKQNKTKQNKIKTKTKNQQQQPRQKQNKTKRNKKQNKIK